MKKQAQQFKKGFTLVEMMVAVAVFSIVMITAASALLNVINANRKAQAIKTAINNINFALEGISKDMRVGTDYECSDDGGSNFGSECIGGGDAIKYRSSRAYTQSDGKHGFAFYRYNNDAGVMALQACVEKDSVNDCDEDGEFSALTSEEIIIENARFYVVGNEPIDEVKQQPRMIMTLTGVAGTGERVETRFDLQTSVSQRARILE